MLALRRTGDIGVAEPAGTDLSVTPSGLNSRATLGGESQFLALSRRGRSTRILTAPLSQDQGKEHDATEIPLHFVGETRRDVVGAGVVDQCSG